MAAVVHFCMHPMLLHILLSLFHRKQSRGSYCNGHASLPQHVPGFMKCTVDNQYTISHTNMQPMLQHPCF